MERQLEPGVPPQPAEARGTRQLVESGLHAIFLSREANEDLRIAITAEGIRFVNEYEDVMQRWSAFSKFRASQRVVLLYFGHNPSFVRVISRAWFSLDSEWSRFLAYVARKLPAG